MEKALTSKGGSDGGADGVYITGGENSLCKCPVAEENKTAERRHLVP